MGSVRLWEGFDALLSVCYGRREFRMQTLKLAVWAKSAVSARQR